MDLKKEKFNINSYILYKSNNDWHEGRVTNIIHEDSKETYHLFSLFDFTNKQFTSSDCLSNATTEIKRKMKISPFTQFPNSIHIPPTLINILNVDKELAAENQNNQPFKIPASAVVAKFAEFITRSFNISDSDEIVEVHNGFNKCFDFFVTRYLLYDTEKNSIQSYGPIHLLRLVYFLQKKGKDFIGDPQTRMILLDYTVYLLDFMLMNYKELFQ